MKSLMTEATHFEGRAISFEGDLVTITQALAAFIKKEDEENGPLLDPVIYINGEDKNHLTINLIYLDR